MIGKSVEKDFVLNEFPMLGEIPRQLLELGEDWKAWVLCDRDPIDTWTDGKVVLIGDAAHPMLQYAAQGACQALEDAVVLGELIGGCELDFAQRFEKFNAERRERTGAIQLLAREMGRQLYHPVGDAAKARNEMLAGFTAEQLHDKVEWLHGATVFAESGAESSTPMVANSTAAAAR